jgi:hypothetical protein
MQSISSAVSNASRLSQSRERSREAARDGSADSQGFLLPGRVRKQNKRRERQRQQVITGSGATNSGNFRGAPEPSRDIFVFRVEPGTQVADLRTHLADMDVTVRALHCVSNAEARYKSFRLTVPLSDFDIVFDGSLWPEGVRVRRYFPRKDEASAARGTNDD